MASQRKKTSRTLVSKNRLPAFLKSKTYPSNSVRETLRLAQWLAKKLPPGAVVALQGELGSGKTHFIKGLAKGLGVKDTDQVKSPTFVLMHVYRGRLPIRHFDWYRLEKEAELDALGFDEIVTEFPAIAVVEWADRAPSRIPSGAVWVRLKITGPHSRLIEIQK